MNTPVTPTPTSPTSAPSSIPQMPPVSAKAPTATTPSKKKFPLKYILGGLLLLLVVIGGGVSYYLSQRSQDIRQQAAGDPYCFQNCMAAGDNANTCNSLCNGTTNATTPLSSDLLCPDGSVKVNGSCDSSVTCPAGTTMISGVCTGATGTDGTIPDSNTVNCPSGTVMVNGVCTSVAGSGTITGGTTGSISSAAQIGNLLTQLGGGTTCMASCYDGGGNSTSCSSQCANSFPVLSDLAGQTTGIVRTTQQAVDTCKTSCVGQGSTCVDTCLKPITDTIGSDISPFKSQGDACVSACSSTDTACINACGQKALSAAVQTIGQSFQDLSVNTFLRVLEIEGCNPSDLTKLNCSNGQTAQCVGYDAATNTKGTAKCAPSVYGDMHVNGNIKCFEMGATIVNNKPTAGRLMCEVSSACGNNITSSQHTCTGELQNGRCVSGTPSTGTPTTVGGKKYITVGLPLDNRTASSCNSGQIDLNRANSTDTAASGYCGAISFNMGTECTYSPLASPSPITLNNPSSRPATSGTGGTSTPNNPPGTNPPASTPPGSYACDSYCTSNAQCTGVNSGYTCTNNRCRLASNPNSSTCSPTEYTCNSTCTGDSQCQAINSSYVCSSGRCRLNSNPSSESCTPSTVGPVCLNLSISKQNPIKGDTVTFTCGQVTGATKYEFRVKLPSGEIRNIQAAASGSNVSRSFTVNGSGAHTAQCRICTGTDGSNCQAYESL